MLLLFIWKMFTIMCDNNSFHCGLLIDYIYYKFVVKKYSTEQV